MVFSQERTEWKSRGMPATTGSSEHKLWSCIVVWRAHLHSHPHTHSPSLLHRRTLIPTRSLRHGK